MKFPEKTKTDKVVFWLIFFLATIATYFFALDLPLIGPDEPRYAQVAREMHERRDFITPTLGGFEWFEKPVLLYWLQILSYSMFGVSEFSARLGSAIFGLSTILVLWILGRAIRENTEFANWVSLVTSTSIGMIAFSRGASFDIILTFPITASLASFFIALSMLEEQSAKRTENLEPLEIKNSKGLTVFHKVTSFLANPKRPFTWLFGFYFFTGVATLAKGLVGVIFPFATVTLFYLLQRKVLQKQVLISILPGIVLTFSVAGIWYLPMYEKHGWRFIDEFIIQHHFKRYTSNKYLHPQPFWFFWLVLPLMTLPWTPFFLLATWKSSKNIYLKLIKAKPTLENTSRIELFALCWMIVPLIFFSFSGSKLPGYILPALPAACILTANYLYELIQKHRQLYKALFAMAFAMLLSVIILLESFADRFIQHETLKPLLVQASQKGYESNKILTLHTIAHNLEFYGAGRLIRTNDGKQRYFYGVAEIAEFMRLNNEKTVLVFVPLRYEKEIAETDLLRSERLGDNGELALFVVSTIN
jgi:4-amino-4-deoxy-L-arabinose transferase-like glycosyltransferase